MSDEIVFKRRFQTSGTSTVTTIPPELLKYIGADLEGYFMMTGKTTKKGKCILLWKKGEDIDEQSAEIHSKD